MHVFPGIAGRELLGFSVPYLNNTGKAQALAVSQNRTLGTLEALATYDVETMPINIQDLLTPMGNFTDTEVLWSNAVLAAKYIPAGVDYAIKSLPDTLDEIRQLVKTDWSNVAGMEKLVSCPPDCQWLCKPDDKGSSAGPHPAVRMV